MPRPITRRNFLKKTGLVTAVALTGVGKLEASNKTEPKQNLQTLYNVPIKSKNPCCERMFFGQNKDGAEECASANYGTVRFTVYNDKKQINSGGSYQVPLKTQQLNNNI